MFDDSGAPKDVGEAREALTHHFSWLVILHSQDYRLRHSVVHFRFMAWLHRRRQASVGITSLLLQRRGSIRCGAV